MPTHYGTNYLGSTKGGEYLDMIPAFDPVHRARSPNPFAPAVRNLFEEDPAQFSALFAPENFRIGLGSLAPFLGQYRNPILRNPGLVQSAYERFELENPKAGADAIPQFFEQFDPAQFTARLSPFQRGQNPSQFMGRQRRIFR